ncbi:MAG: DUF4126 domain-containing protein [Ignavibacteriaceae bacterium]|nr:DUF4126 domain-containing protein [Ignavibacteriaceae bacterium]
METLTSILLGIGLSAATGFRIFVPFLVVSIAAITGYLPLSPSFEWIGTYPALIAFGAASILEIAAYYIPWLDNLLDSIATPAAFIAGAILMVAVLSGLPPLVKWALAIIAGSGAAGIVQTGTTMTRAVSTTTTGGLANPVVSAVEAGTSFGMSLLAILLPVFAGLITIVLLSWLVSKMIKKLRTN